MQNTKKDRKALAILAIDKSKPNAVSEGYTVARLISAGYTVARLISAGYTVARLISEGYTVADLISEGYTVADLISEGYTVADLISEGYTVARLISAGYTVARLISAGYTVARLISEGYTVADLVRAGYTVADLINAGYTVADLINAGVSEYDLEEWNSIPLLNKPYTSLLNDINNKKRIHQQSTFGPEECVSENNVCGTAMCTAGHLVNMAGAMGWKLKEKYGWKDAATLLHLKSHPNYPVQNFGGIPQSWALAYIEEMAEKESNEN